MQRESQRAAERCQLSSDHVYKPGERYASHEYRVDFRLTQEVINHFRLYKDYELLIREVRISQQRKRVTVVIQFYTKSEFLKWLKMLHRTRGWNALDWFESGT